MGRFHYFVATAAICAVAAFSQRAGADVMSFNSGSLSASVQADSVAHGGIVSDTPPNVTFTTDLSPHSIEASASAQGFANIDFTITSTRSTNMVSIQGVDVQSVSTGFPNNNVQGNGTAYELITLSSAATLVSTITNGAHTQIQNIPILDSTGTTTEWIFFGGDSHAFAAGQYLIRVPFGITNNGASSTESATATISVLPEPTALAGVPAAVTILARRRWRR